MILIISSENDTMTDAVCSWLKELQQHVIYNFQCNKTLFNV